MASNAHTCTHLLQPIQATSQAFRAIAPLSSFTQEQKYAVILTLFTQLDNIFGTSFHACTTCDTFVFIYFGKKSLGINVNGVKQAGFNAIAQTEASKNNLFRRRKEPLRWHNWVPVVYTGLRTIFACAVASYHSNFFDVVGDVFPKGRQFYPWFLVLQQDKTNRPSFRLLLPPKQIPGSRKSASATVGPGKYLLLVR